jgi:tetratricopeptide (TPR) repeat protein
MVATGTSGTARAQCPSGTLAADLAGRLDLAETAFASLDADRFTASMDDAALAVDCLESLAGSIDDNEYRQLAVRAFAWLSNAHRLGLNFQEAERVLRQGEEALRPECAQRVRCELNLIKSGLRMSQRRMDEAMRLANQVVASMASVEDPVFRMRSWLHRAHLYHYMGKTAESTTDLWRAYGLSDQVDDTYLLSALYQMLSLKLALDGKHREAVRFLPVARALCEQLEFEKGMCYLEWTEGLVSQDLGHLEKAEGHLRRARSAFHDHGNSYLGGLVALDLAILCAVDGRSSECAQLAGEVIEIFTSHNVPYECVKALHVLQRALAAEEISRAALQQFRAAIVKNPPRTA